MNKVNRDSQEYKNLVSHIENIERTVGESLEVIRINRWSILNWDNLSNLVYDQAAVSCLKEIKSIVELSGSAKEANKKIQKKTMNIIKIGVDSTTNIAEKLVDNEIALAWIGYTNETETGYNLNTLEKMYN